ncbi:MAG: uncharacterized protein PWP38_195 [Clostridiales bacterium]|nr:uncharacterized protein [Clostridiales bacterium]
MGDSTYQIEVKMSDDYYKAFVSFEPETEGVPIKSDDLIKAIKDRNVVFGIKYNVVEDICKQGRTVHSVLIAEGVPHENGQDAVIEFTVEKEKKAKPQILDDGRVDFKNLGYVDVVSAEDVLAVKTPATKSKNGTTVSGRVIRGKDGKDVAFKIGKNVRISQDGLSVIAETDGSVIFDGDKISVIKLLELRSDVGVETGNIFFHGQVVVNGNVTTGYSIECDGDVTINGVVEGATIKSGGNIVISRGVQGMDVASIECNGSLTVNFINSAKINVRGDIESGAIMNSIVNCDGNIHVKGKKGLIVGGEITCKGDIEANTVGSELGVITSVKLGVDMEIIEELKTLSADVKDTMALHDKLDKSLKLLKIKIDQNPDDERSLFMFRKYSSSFLELDTQLTEKRQRLKMLNELVNNIRGSSLSARTIYPGTRLKIGSTSYYVKNEMKHTILLKDRGEIVARTN